MIYVLKYEGGAFVKVDNSTGPMSTGGYPLPTADVQEATHFDTVEAARKYGDVMGWDKFEARVYAIEIRYRVYDVLPAKVWTECNRRCERSPESTAPDAPHYLNCTLMYNILAGDGSGS